MHDHQMQGGGLRPEAVIGYGRTGYRPDIDGLRAFAVTAVVLYHAHAPLIKSGFVGVDIFFVISGYLIGGILYRETSRGQFSFVAFYARRARRIGPALFAVVAFTIGLGCLLQTAGELKELAATAIAALAGVSNVRLWLRTDYFSPDASLNPLLMTWSLGVEEQFYVLLPPLMLAMRRLNLRAITAAVAILSAMSFWMSILLTGSHPPAAFYLLPSRAWELGVGVLLALWHVRRPPQLSSRDRRVDWVSACGAGLLVLSVMMFRSTTAFPGLAACAPTLGAALLIATPGGVVNRRVLCWRPVVFVGLTSYSWYLWHWPLISFAQIAMDRAPSFTSLWPLVPISFGLGVLSWRCIERPLRTARSPASAALVRYATALVVMLGLATSLKVAQGLPARLSPEARQTEALLARGRGECLAPIGSTILIEGPACTPAGPLEAVALVGDSHASALGPGLSKAAAAAGVRLVKFMKSSCPPLLGYSHFQAQFPHDVTACKIYQRNLVDRLVSDASIRTVVVAAEWALPPSASDYWVDEAGSRAPQGAAVAEGLGGLIDTMRRAGKRVVVVGDTPHFIFDPAKQSLAQAIPLRAWFRQALEGPLGRSDLAPWADVIPDGGVRSVVQRTATAHGAAYLDLQPVFCTAQGCIHQQEGAPLFFDPHHLSVAGSALAAKALGPVAFASGGEPR